MQCPRCKKKMTLKKEGSSFDRRKKPPNEYEKKLWVCRKDDIWVTVETPA